MKIEILRSRGYRGESLEAGRVYLVDANFAGWMVMRGFARYYTEPVANPAAVDPEPVAESAKVKRGRPTR